LRGGGRLALVRSDGLRKGAFPNARIRVEERERCPVGDRRPGHWWDATRGRCVGYSSSIFAGSGSAPLDAHPVQDEADTKE
jgi:hypothetical protein